MSAMPMLVTPTSYVRQFYRYTRFLILKKQSLMSTPTKTTAHSVYNLNYHIVFVTKYRNKVLFGAIEEYIKEQLPVLCERYGWEMLALEVMPDHVLKTIASGDCSALFLSAPPSTAPNTIARTLKSILTVSVFTQFPTLKKKRFWGSGLCSGGTYYGSAGTVSAATIQRYIENQKTKADETER